MSVDSWINDLCSAFNLDSKTLDDKLILDKKTYPNALNTIEQVALGTDRSIFHKGLTKNIYTVPIKFQFQFLANEKNKRLKNYSYNIPNVTGSNTAIIQVVCGSNKYDLPKVIGQDKAILYDLVEYDHIKKEWVKSSQTSRIRVPLHDATDLELCKVLFSPETADNITYKGIDFFLPKGLKHDYTNKLRVITMAINVTEEKTDSGGTLWKVDSLPFVPYTGQISYISLKKWSQSFLPLDDIKNSIVQNDILKEYPTLADELAESKIGGISPLSPSIVSTTGSSVTESSSSQENEGDDIPVSDSVKAKLNFNLALLYNDLDTCNEGDSWLKILAQLKNLTPSLPLTSKGGGNVLLVDNVEKVFSWDINFLEMFQIKHVHYGNMVYNVEWDNVRVKGPVGNRQHVVKLVLPPKQGTNKAYVVFVVWKAPSVSLETDSGNNTCNSSKGCWVEDPDETEELFKQRRPIKDDYIDVPFLLIWHNPPQMPKWMDYGSSPQTILKRSMFQKSLPHCLGVITFSNYMADWLNTNLPSVQVFDKSGKIKDKKTRKINVLSLKYPTDEPKTKFSYDGFFKNDEKFLIQSGYWMKRKCFIGTLKTETYGKLWLYGGDRALEILQNERFEHHMTDEPCSDLEDVVVTKLDKSIYENLLTNNILIANFYDLNYSGDIVDAITHNTPILINYHPAAVEYLGKNYPLYYRTSEEARLKAHNVDMIKAAYNYLKTSNLAKLHTYDAFILSFLGSDLIKDLNKKYGKFKPAEEWQHPPGLSIPISPRPILAPSKIGLNEAKIGVMKQVDHIEKGTELERKLGEIGKKENNIISRITSALHHHTGTVHHNNPESPSVHLKHPPPPTPNSTFHEVKTPSKDGGFLAKLSLSLHKPHPIEGQPKSPSISSGEMKAPPSPLVQLPSKPKAKHRVSKSVDIKN